MFLQGHGKAVDWWTLGVLTYELMAGLPPWYEPNDQQAMYRMILDAANQPVMPSSWSKAVRDFISKLLEVGNLREEIGGG